VSEKSIHQGPAGDSVRAAWETNAPFWDAYFKEGNDFHRTLVGPAAEALLEIVPGERVLDIACGNGAFSRRLASLGARVTAFDFSATFIERAVERTTELLERITYHVLDATDPAQWAVLGDVRFDAAVCNMALMDMSDIEVLARELPQHLTPSARFVFTTMHPCFNHVGCRMSIEEEDRDGDLITTYGVRVTRYMTPFSARGIGIRGQPVPQVYFHRPLHVLLRPFLDAGFVLNGLDEHAFGGSVGGQVPTSWGNFPEIPPLLAARLIPAANRRSDA